MKAPSSDFVYLVLSVVLFVLAKTGTTVSASLLDTNNSTNDENSSRSSSSSNTRSSDGRVLDQADYHPKKWVFHDSWYDLTGYLIGLVVCLCGLVGFYCYQFASYYFIKQYLDPTKTEQRTGRILSCEPIRRRNNNNINPSSSSSSSSTSSSSRQKYTKKRNEIYDADANNNNGRSIHVFPMAGEIVDQQYYKEEELQKNRKEEEQQQQKRNRLRIIKGIGGQPITEYRMLVVYSVPTNDPSSISNLCLCSSTSCDPVGIIDYTVSVNGDCSSGMSHKTYSGAARSSRIDRANIAIDTYYRSTSLPNIDNVINNNSSNKTPSIFESKQQGPSTTQYFQWYRMKEPRHVDECIDLILLKEYPTSACTIEMIHSHLALFDTKKNPTVHTDVYGRHKYDNDDTTTRRRCRTVSLLEILIMLAILLLVTVCVLEILSMPGNNLGTQREIGFTILFGIIVGSIVGGYLFGQVLFEQHKNKVFLSAFVIPTKIAVLAGTTNTAATTTNPTKFTPMNNVVINTTTATTKATYLHNNDEVALLNTCSSIELINSDTIIDSSISSSKSITEDKNLSTSTYRERLY